MRCIPTESYSRRAGGVVGPCEQAHARYPREQQVAEVGERRLRVPAPAQRRIDPHLRELDRGRSPRRGFGLEADPAVLEPQPAAPALDLASRPPGEEIRVPGMRVDPHLLEVRRRAGGHEHVEIVEGRGAQACARRGQAGGRSRTPAVRPIVERHREPSRDRLATARRPPAPLRRSSAARCAPRSARMPTRPCPTGRGWRPCGRGR